MGVVKNLMVRCGADFSALTKAANKAQASVSSMQKGVNKSTGSMQKSFLSLKRVAGLALAAFSVAKITSFAKESSALYKEQIANETKLAAIMKARMGLTNAAVKDIINFMKAEQQLGVVSSAVMTAGAQELATYVNEADTLKTLIPLLNNIATQQYGVDVTASQLQSTATMLGKVIDGQLGGLSRWGYSWTAAQEEILKTGSKMERAAVIADVTAASVGNMNYALAQTDVGRQKQLANTFGDIKLQIGDAANQIKMVFLPVLNVLAQAFVAIASWVQVISYSIRSVFGGSAAKSVNVTAASLAGAAGNAEDLADAIEEAGKVAKGSTAAFDNLNVLTQPADISAGAVDSPTVFGGINIAADMEDDTGGAASLVERMAERIKAALEPLKSINLTNIKNAFQDLKDAVAPITEKLFDGLKWAWGNIFVPIGQWTMEEAAPAFLNAIRGALDVLNPVLDVFKELGRWLWSSFLQPIAAWTGGIVVSVLNDLGNALSKIGNWMADNISLIKNITIAVGAFFIAWEIATLAEFIINAGGVIKILGTLTSAIWTNIAAKAADKLETLAIIGLYAKDFIVSVANSIAAIAKNTAVWVASTAAKAANTIAQIAMTAATVAWNAICVVATAVTTAFGAAVAFLTSPIGLVIAAVAAIIAIIVLLIKNWDTVKEVALNVWEKIKEIWSIVAEWFQTKIVEPIANFFSNLWSGIKETASKAWEGIKEVWSAVTGWFKEKIIQPVKDFFTGLWEGIKQAAANAWEGIKAVWGLVTGWFKEKIIEPIAGFFTGLWNGVKETASKVWEGIKEIWGIVAGWFKGAIIEPVASFFSGMWDGVKNLASGAWDGIKSIWNGAANFFSGIWSGIKNAFGSVTDWFRDMFSKAWEAVKNVFSAGGKVFDGIKDGILDGLKTVINAIITGINKVIKVPFDGINFALDKIRNISILGLEPFKNIIFTINTPQIPLLAEGGLVDSATLAMIGEAGKEAVLPLEDNTGWMDILAEKIALNGKVTFDGPPDLMELVRVLRPSFIAMDRVKGKNLIIGGI